MKYLLFNNDIETVNKYIKALEIKFHLIPFFDKLFDLLCVKQEESPYEYLLTEFNNLKNGSMRSETITFTSTLA